MTLSLIVLTCQPLYKSTLKSIYIPENKGSLRCVLSNLLESSKRKII